MHTRTQAHTHTHTFRQYTPSHTHTYTQSCCTHIISSTFNFAFRKATTNILCAVYGLLLVGLGIVLPLSAVITQTKLNQAYYVDVRASRCPANVTSSRPRPTFRVDSVTYEWEGSGLGVRGPRTSLRNSA